MDKNRVPIVQPTVARGHRCRPPKAAVPGQAAAKSKRIVYAAGMHLVQVVRIARVASGKATCGQLPTL